MSVWCQVTPRPSLFTGDAAYHLYLIIHGTFAFVARPERHTKSPKANATWKQPSHIKKIRACAKIEAEETMWAQTSTHQSKSTPLSGVPVAVLFDSHYV